MNWSKIKTMMIAVLTAVNLFFGVMLVMQYVTNSRIDRETQSNTVSLMREAGILLDEEVIPDRIPTLKIWEYAFDNDYSKRVVARLTGTENGAWHMISNGVKCILEDSGDVFEFSDSSRFSVTYSKNAGENAGSVTADYVDEASRSRYREDVSDAKLRRLMKSIRRFLTLDAGVAAEPDIGLTADSAFQDPETGRYIVCCRETIGKTPLYGSDLTFVLYNENVLYMSGLLILPEKAVGYSAGLVDQINVLFLEKAQIEAEEQREEVSILSLTLEYCVNWNSDRTNYYLIPAWKIVYSDETIRVRNAVSGNIYTK